MCTCDEGGSVTGEEGDGLRHLVRLARPPQRMRRLAPLQELKCSPFNLDEPIRFYLFLNCQRYFNGWILPFEYEMNDKKSMQK